MSAPRVLFVGVGGLGCPAARALASLDISIVLLDDDVVDETNLHRQILFDPEDVGHPKAEVAAKRLAAMGSEVEARVDRFLPESARRHLVGIDVVIEGSDNFATKFLVADACALARIPSVHAGASGWSGWSLATDPRGAEHAPCLRCVFEDVPDGSVPTCADVGVVGPVVGVLGALQARLARDLLTGASPVGRLHHYRALEGNLRQVTVRARAACPLHPPLRELTLHPDRYLGPCH